MASDCKVKGSSWFIYKLRLSWQRLSSEKNAMSKYWGDVMSITDGVRWNLSKDFSYIGGFRGKHFKQHAELVKNKIKYRWLIYSYSNEQCAENDWGNYKERLVKLGVDQSVFEDQVQFKKLTVREKYKRIPWRITIFDDGITLSSPERERRSYGLDSTTVAFPSEETEDLLDKFKKLWNEPDNRNSLDDFQKTFLRCFAEEYPKDVPIYKLERSLTVLRLTFIITAVLIGLSILVDYWPHIMKWWSSFH